MANRGTKYLTRREKRWKEQGILKDDKSFLDWKTYEDVLNFQNYRCAICGVSYIWSTLTADHDHETGLFRGILCSDCNHHRLATFEKTGKWVNRTLETILTDYIELPPYSMLRNCDRERFPCWKASYERRENMNMSHEQRSCPWCVATFFTDSSFAYHILNEHNPDGQWMKRNREVWKKYDYGMNINSTLILISDQIKEINNHLETGNPLDKVVNEFCDIVSLSSRQIELLGYDFSSAMLNRIEKRYAGKTDEIVAKYNSLHNGSV